MQRVQLRRAARVALFFLLYVLLALHASAQTASQPAEEPAASIKSSPLPMEDVVRNLQQKNAERAAALEEFAGTRVYRMQYRGIPSDHDAEMVVQHDFPCTGCEAVQRAVANGIEVHRRARFS